MTQRNYGTGVSRVLDAEARQFTNVIFQQGKPPLDSEFLLLADLTEDWRRTHVLRGCPSGVIGNAVNNEEDFVTNVNWSNWFRIGQQATGEARAILWACVNGWLVPVTGTKTGTPPGAPNDSDTWNKITLNPPPANSGDSRIDFIFLEVWLARVPPNPSTLNKPSASTLYRYGNVESGYTYLADDIQDPAIGFETTQRVQLQYRVRVVSGLVGLTSYPDGFDPTVVRAQGAASSETSYTFTNMRRELGDPGLWRAGDGTANSLGTVDGYTYAVPLCAVFRRNSVAWDGDPGQNLNGGFNRNPTAVDRTGAKTFTAVATTSAALTDSALSVTLTTATGIPLLLTPATDVFVQIGDEILSYSAITGTTMTISARGQLGTKAEAHPSGSTITVISGRPDGLFSDQIAKTDILDLRHVVNPNGFNYDALLKSSLDKLLRGDLRANWKRTGGGPQGPFVFHQDKISASPAALGVTKLDSPDGHRTVFSDAAMQQVMEFVATPPPSGTGPGQNITTTWDLTLSGTVNNSVVNLFSPGDIITIPVSQLKNSLGTDTDQVQFISDPGAVSIRVDGYPDPLVEGTHFAVTPVNDSTDDLIITLDGVNFPALDPGQRLFITFHVLWGPGRGISRRPDQVHSVSYLSAHPEILIRQKGIPADNTPMNSAWTSLWSKYRDTTFHNLLPVTSESYIDLGSKTVILTPFRRISLTVQHLALDGTNINRGTVLETQTDGVGNGTTTFTSASADFVTAGIATNDVLYIPSGVAAGYYTVSSVSDANTLVLASTVPIAVGLTFYLHRRVQGLMPTYDIDGNAKWATTDPLALFSGSQQGDPDRKNIYLKLPRHMVPGWGEVRVPIVHTDTANFHEGINFLVHTTKGAKTAAGNESEVNYLSFNGTSLTAPFSTVNLNSYPGPLVPATYNAAFAYGGKNFAGIRFFTDTRGLGRTGLELPPFYGIARLFAVYEAEDFRYNGGSNYDANQNVIGGMATNLLRQDFEGPVFWIETDEDGDSTFILNSEALDLSKSPNPIASFASGNYVIEATIFGFDRGTFNLDSDARLVLCRNRDTVQANTGTRSENVSTYFGGGGNDSELETPDLVIPGPAHTSDEIAINYSRTPYQGDAWGSQSLQQDIPHKAGPLLTSTMYQILSTELDEANLTRPNQKTLEVLASVGFITTLGTGRLSGDLPSGTFDFRNVGYEDGDFPTSGADPRPPLAVSALNSASASDIGSSYHGCTERLPLGALYRDKDFRGDFIGGSYTSQVQAPLLFTNNYGPGITSSSIAVNSSFEQTGVQVGTSSLSSGQPGEIVVHVDGEQGNYGLLVNFRTNRGGSGFTAFAPRPGGEFASAFQPAGLSSTRTSVLVGTAYLVRNTVTNIGSTEVSAGGELMMLVTTTAAPLSDSVPQPLKTFVGTNGSGEGWSAVDLYRISGHPVESDHVRIQVDPSSIALPRKSSTY